MSERAQDTAAFGTFAGVFRPIVLTILGAMLYLREGWLVGNLGLGGALLVLVAAYVITGTTALSLASIASNVRVRPGGAFAIIAQALGLEAGGAIGIPLYIAQAASSAMYIYAFTEAWAVMFPEHDPRIVAGFGFTGVALLAWRSAGLAMKAQALMTIVVGLALVSAMAGLGVATELHAPALLGTGDVSLVTAFAIFFPAATGVMVGAGMSGMLADPRRSIPQGSLAAWATTFVIYGVFAVWYSVMGTPEELASNKSFMIENSAVPVLVLAGLLSSTLMAALSSLVAAPQLLAAMADHRVLPGHRWLARRSASGEPRNAVLATTGLGALGLAAGSLDAIAPIITSFFVLTYLAINAVVYVEQLLGMISFRPAFRIPRVVSLVGVGFCLVGLSLASPLGGVVEIALVLGIYAALSRRKLDTPWETVRSGIAVSVASWAARLMSDLERNERAWKPELLVPVATVEQAKEMRPMAEALAKRNGSVRWVALGEDAELIEALPRLVTKERGSGFQSAAIRMRTTNPLEGLSLVLDALDGGALFPPNLILASEWKVDETELQRYLAMARELKVGLAVWLLGPTGTFERPTRIVVWLSERSPEWTLRLHSANLDLPVLVGFLLAEAWGAELVIATVVRDAGQERPARRFLTELIDQARLPKGTLGRVEVGSFDGALSAMSDAGLHIFGMPPSIGQARIREIRDRAEGSCLWLLDSGRESALA